MNVKRSDIKYNFLKRIIIRIDYNGVLERELEKTIEVIKPIFKEHDFDRFEEGMINEVDFEIKDPEQIETQRMISVKELNSTKTFMFLNSKERIQVQINKFFMSLEVEYTKYIQFEHLSNLFYLLFNEIRKNNDYIRYLRLGLRKINNCLLLDINKLNKVINESYFKNVTDIFNDGKVKTLQKQNVDSFIYKDINVNLIRYLSSGILNINGEEKEAYQLALDIDAYKNDEDELKVLLDGEKMNLELTEYNTILFNTYISMLNEEFIQKLVDGNIDEFLLGVDKND